MLRNIRMIRFNIEYGSEYKQELMRKKYYDQGMESVRKSLCVRQGDHTFDVAIFNLMDDVN